ncbi:hypothetical protein Droror1_Dr00009719 [Drosera rotundifolia]
MLPLTELFIFLPFQAAAAIPGSRHHIPFTQPSRLHLRPQPRQPNPSTHSFTLSTGSLTVPRHHLRRITTLPPREPTTSTPGETKRAKERSMFTPGKGVTPGRSFAPGTSPARRGANLPHRGADFMSGSDVVFWLAGERCFAGMGRAATSWPSMPGRGFSSTGPNCLDPICRGA